MNRIGNKLLVSILGAGVLGLLIILALWQLPQEVRGKGSARPLAQPMTDAQQTAQTLALADPLVQAFTNGQRSEVLGVRRVGNQFTEASAACETAVCWQVEIYSFDENTAVVAVTNPEAGEVLDVLRMPGMQPGSNQRMADRALEIAFNAPEVIDALGFRPTQADMVPVAAGMLNTTCDEGHYCMGPTFDMGDQILWAIVDITDETLAGIAYTDVSEDGSAELFVPEGNDCPPPGSVSRDGWEIEYEVTGTDGLSVFDVSYNGMEVIRNAKLVEWHVDYNDTYIFQGFRDVTGCGGGGGGFQIYPFGNTEILTLTNGFELVQDFRMPLWGEVCNYRYEQRLQFFADGSFRLVGGAYGRGCGEFPVYRPVTRIDLAINGDDNDSFAHWTGERWQVALTETIRGPQNDLYGPHAFTEANYGWWVMDESGAGYLIETSNGQFDAETERGDAPYLYVTRHHPAEGDTDLPAFSSNYCCYDDERQGPDTFVNGESVTGENIVLWYVSQHQTDAFGMEEDGNGRYCWAVNGEPEPEAYPCFGGPRFTPFGLTETVEITAAFTVDSPVIFPNPVVINNSSSSNVPVNYVWQFGASELISNNPIYRFVTPGLQTVSLTVDGFANGSDTVSQTVEVLVPSVNHLPLITR